MTDTHLRMIAMFLLLLAWFAPVFNDMRRLGAAHTLRNCVEWRTMLIVMGVWLFAWTIVI